MRVHAQEALLEAARERQQSPEGRAALRARVAAEHALARLAGLGIGQAKYCGRRKTRVQLLLAATVANLRRVWNWEHASDGCWSWIKALWTLLPHWMRPGCLVGSLTAGRRVTDDWRDRTPIRGGVGAVRPLYRPRF